MPQFSMYATAARYSDGIIYGSGNVDGRIRDFCTGLGLPTLEYDEASYEDGGYIAAQKVVARIFGTLLDEVCVGKPKTKTHTYRGIGHYLRFTEYPPQHIGIIKNYTDYLLKKTDKFIAPGEQGITGLTFSNAIHLASWTGREVTIPIDEEKFLAELEERKREEEAKMPNKKS